MTAPILEIRDLVKRYRTHTALSGVSLDIQPGEIFALLGPNGAGKTTLIGAVCGLVKKTSGTVRLFGVDLDEDPFGPRYQVGLVPQEVNFDPFFTVRESLEVQLGYYGKTPDQGRVQEVLEALSLKDKAKVWTRALSGGMRRRLLIGKALAHRPKLVFLDEPTAGVDVELRQELWRYVRRLKAEGTTIILTTHYLEEAEALADRVGVINDGRLLLVEEKDALMKRLGEKRLEVTFGQKVAALPELAAMNGVVLSEDGQSLSYAETEGRTSCGDVLRGLYRAGLPVMDVETRRSRLEDVLLDVLRGKGARQGTGFEAARISGGGGKVGGEGEGAAQPSGGRARSRRAMNTVGLRMLFVKEILRFLRVPVQTVISPLISTVLYFAVFGYSLGGRVRLVHGIPYLLFIVPGLIFQITANNSFITTSSSLFMRKVQNTMVDLLVAPLGPFELLAGFIGAGMVRGLLLGLLTWGVAGLFTGFALPHPLAAMGFMLLSTYVFSVFGLLGAIWAEKFEQISFFPTFVMLPLTFLGGIFYPVQDLPSPWRTITLFNPMVYLVEGLRYGMLGTSPLSPLLGVGLLGAGAVVITALTTVALRVGYKLKT